MKIIGYRKIYYVLSGAMVLVSIVAVGVWQFRYGIDFVGGTLWEIVVEREAAQGELEETFRGFGIENVSVTPGAVDAKEMILRFRKIDEHTHQEILGALRERFGEVDELRFETVGPTIGRVTRQRAVQSVIGVLVAIALYVMWAFRRVSRPIASWQYGAVTLVTLFHDIMAPVGLFAFLGRFAGVEIDSQFIVSLLVLMGFSVNDTIVVFDRIRENLHNAPKGELFENTVEKSVRETLVRSVNTSLTLFLVLAGLFIWGPDTLRYFVLSLMVGTMVGAYSSIFLASPLLVDLARRARG